MKSRLSLYASGILIVLGMIVLLLARVSEGTKPYGTKVGATTASPQVLTQAQTRQTPASSVSNTSDVATQDTPSPDSSPNVRILDLTFINSLSGWAVGYKCPDPFSCNPITLMWRTTDGGVSWRALPAPQMGIGTTRHEINNIYFANSNDGWAFGPGFFSTHDGGLTWGNNSRGNETIGDLQAIGGKLWGLSSVCAFNCGPLTLVSSDDMGRTWSAAQPQPNIYRSAAGESLASLTVGAEHDMWILSDLGLEVTQPPNSSLLVTHDLGKTWKALPNPPCDSYVGGRLAELPNGRLWLLCPGQPAVGNQEKALYISYDGGMTWKEISNSDSNDPKGLQFGGYAGRLVVTSPDRAWIGGSGLMGTTDGGVKWDFPSGPEPSPGPSLDYGLPIFAVTFMDPAHGWFATGDAVYRTSDSGQTWQWVRLR